MLLTRLVFDFDAIEEEVCNEIHGFSRLEHKSSEFLMGGLILSEKGRLNR
jgi:hypothetical protein